MEVRKNPQKEKSIFLPDPDQEAELSISPQPKVSWVDQKVEDEMVEHSKPLDKTNWDWRK